MHSRTILLCLVWAVTAGPILAQDAPSSAPPMAPDPPPAGSTFVHVRLLHPDETPVVGARVEFQGVGTAHSTGWGGSRGFDPETVSARNGEFILHRQEPFTRVQVELRAEGLAMVTLWIPASNQVQVIHLGPGATLAGRIVIRNQPLAGVRVGVCNEDRASERFAGHFETTTDQEGRFEFRHLPTDTSWYAYGLIDSLKSHGSVAPRLVRTGGDGETRDLGDLVVEPGLSLEGRLIPAPGSTLPATSMEVYAGYSTAWDLQRAPVDPDGRFRLEGLHATSMEFGLWNRDWHLTGRNRSLVPYLPQRMKGTLLSSRTNFLVEVAPGQKTHAPARPSNGRLPVPDRPENRPLSGVEQVPNLIRIRGTVVDEKTGKPLPQATVLPGRQPPIISAAAGPTKPLFKRMLDAFRPASVPFNELPCWLDPMEMALTDGSFDVSFERLSSEPLLQFQAPGYEPGIVGPITHSTNGLIIPMTKGIGPAGVVHTPAGTPARGATLIYAALRDAFTMEATGSLEGYANLEVRQVTTETGTFKFDQRLDGSRLWVSHATGWASLEEEAFGDALKIRLKPWTVVTGTLVDTNGWPVTNQTLTLEFDQPPSQRDLPRLWFRHECQTGPQGRFLLTNVPPADLVLLRIIRVTQPPGAFSTIPQTRFRAEPGGTNDLGQVTFDTPPPEPILRQLRRSLGF